MTDVTSYLDRTIDIAAFEGYQLDGEALLVHALASPGNPGQAITGILKVCQQFLVVWLTPRGTLLYLPEQGTDFIPRLRRGEIHTQLEAEQAFQSALIDIRRQLTATITEDTPDDERFVTAQVLGIAFLTEQLVYRLRIVTVAGSARQVILPIQTRLTGGAL